MHRVRRQLLLCSARPGGAIASKRDFLCHQCRVQNYCCVGVFVLVGVFNCWVSELD